MPQAAKGPEDRNPIRSVRPYLLHQPPSASWRLFAGYMLILLSATALILLVGSILEMVAEHVPRLRRSPAIWGTYGDWAAAILPAYAVLLSVRMWLDDQRRHRYEIAYSRSRSIHMEERSQGRQWIVNKSEEPIVIFSSEANGFDSSAGEILLCPGEEHQLQDAETMPVRFVDPDGLQWAIGRTNPGTHDPGIDLTS